MNKLFQVEQLAMHSLLNCVFLLAFINCMHPLAPVGAFNEQDHFNHLDDKIPTYSTESRASQQDYNNYIANVYDLSLQGSACYLFDPKSTMCIRNQTYLKAGFCATFDEKRRTVSVVVCPFFQLKANFTVVRRHFYWYVPLPENVLELNNFMCEPLNRKGRVCSECKDGYGPSLMSVGYQIQCSNCTGAWYGIPLYLFLEFFPITMFYVIILIFQVNITSAPMTCYIMCSQIILILAWDTIYGGENYDVVNIVLVNTKNTKLFPKIILTLYDVWNLGFFWYLLPPFCVSPRLKPITVAFMGYLSAFYPLFLVLFTWICVQLHAHNFRPLVWLWRPFHGCFVRLRRKIDTSNLVNVFASIFFLSFTKVMTQLELLLTDQRIYSYIYDHDIDRGNDHLQYAQVVEIDLAITYGSAEHLAYFIPAALFCIVFNALPILILIFYPFRFFQSCLSKCRLDGIVLNIFVEKFHSCYRNGLDGGRDMRSFSGLYFITRFMLYLTTSVSGLFKISKDDSYLPKHFVFAITALMIALCRPYKKTYMNVLDTLLLVHMGLICHLISSHEGFKDEANFIKVFEAMMAVPFTGFVLFFLVRTFQTVNIHKIKVASKMCTRSCPCTGFIIWLSKVCDCFSQQNEN